MGLTNSTNNGGTFLTITGSKISRRVPEGTEDAVSRELTAGQNVGKTIWELKYESLSGKIVGGSLDNHKEYGRRISILIEDDGERFMLQLPWNSGIRDQFVKRIPAIDVKKIVEFNAFEGKDQNGKPSPVLLIKQDGANLPFTFTRKDLNGCPPAVQKVVMGEKKWDFEDSETFLWGIAKDFFEQFEGDEKPASQPSPAQNGGDDTPPDGAFSNEGGDTLDEDVPF